MSDHPLDHLEDMADLVGCGRRWIVRGPEVVLSVDLPDGGRLEITPRREDRYDVLLLDQDPCDLGRLLAALSVRVAAAQDPVTLSARAEQHQESAC